MLLVVTIIVYNRYDNLKRWLECWEKMHKPAGTEFRVIHNCSDASKREEYETLCKKFGVVYVPRDNVGMDIGAFQDVCRERLPGFKNDWNYLFWAADDTIPMTLDIMPAFLKYFSTPNTGVVCLEMSKEFKLHIRTSGFMIAKEVAKKLTFPVDRVTTKSHCYLFEHRSLHSFYEQVMKMGKTVIQDKPLPVARLWDIGHRLGLQRWAAFRSVFGEIQSPGNGKVTVISPLYNTFPEIVSSLINQTYQNWELLLIHDGSNSTGIAKVLAAIRDARIKYMEMPKRQELWGHPIRKWALEQIAAGKLSSPEFIVITNPDNYYVPSALEYMVEGFKPGIVATFCDKFVHAYPSHQVVQGRNVVHKWGILDTRIELGWVDCGGVMVRKEVACEVGWPSMEIYSDWTYFETIAKKFGKSNFARVNGCLFVHN